MTTRLRAWLDETHGTGFELLRHFLLRFFDNDMIAIPGEWQKVAIGIGASLFSIAYAALAVYWQRYRILHAQPFGVYRHGVREDLFTFVVLAMAISALLTILQWQSLFPSLRDCLALAGLPVKPRELFAAKFSALLVIFTAFVLALTLAPSTLFAVVTNLKQHENPAMWVSMVANFVVLTGSCAFVFFTLLAIQGVLLQLLPAHAFDRVSVVVQAVMFIAIVGALPLLGHQPTTASWWPSVWFVHLWEAIVIGGREARPAILAMMLPPVLSVFAYLLSYHRYRRMLLESPPARGSARWAGLGARLLERWIPEPREQAAFAFIAKSLFRSRSHRLLLLAYAGAALGWIVSGIVDAPPVKLRDEGLYGLTVVLAPIAVAVLVTIGLRYLFSLPVMLRANWIFQTLEAEDRPAWFDAIERFVIWIGIAPVFAASLPATGAVLGPVRGVAAAMLGCAVSLLFFERAFREWRKLPFTCSYLPAKKPVWALIVYFAMGSGFLVPVAELLLWASGTQAGFIAVGTGLGLLWYRWRGIRRRTWATSALLWDELPAPDVEALNLQRAKDDDAPLSIGAARPLVREFGSSSLTESRGWIPASWREAIAEEQPGARAFWETLVEDVRFGARLIRRNPLLSAVVVLTLTLGIGINASVFTVVNGIALKPHVDRDPDTFVRLIPKSQRDGRIRPSSYTEYIALVNRAKSVRQLAAYRMILAFLGDDDSTGTPGLTVSCNFFLVDGLDRALKGRLFDADDCRAPGQAPVAIISESVWRDRFQSDPAIIGRVARMNNRPVPIVGVVADRTSLWVEPVGVWFPYTAQPYFEPDRNFFQSDLLWLQFAGRLAPGKTRSMAEAEFTGLERQLDGLEPGRHTVVETTSGSWMEEFELRASARDLFLTAFLFAGFYLVLFIACANVATLLLSRAASRRREIAVRLSLGAPRIRLVRMLVTESVLLAAMAGGLSVYLLYHVPQPLFRFLAPTAIHIPLPPDWRIFSYVAIIVVLTGIASGLVPALEAVKVDLAGSMKGTNLLGGARARGWLVTAQVAMSMVLLVEAALFGRAEERNLNGDPGYQPSSVVVAPLRFPDSISAQAAQIRRERIAERMRALPGARAVTFSDDLPMIDYATVEVRPRDRTDAVQAIDVYSASPGFMTAMGVQLVRGRDFTAADGDAVIVSESLARALFPRRNPIGKALDLPRATATIVGVARDSGRRYGAGDNPPVWRAVLTHPSFSFVSVRFASPVFASGPAVRAAIREAEPNLVVMARNLQSWIDLVTATVWHVVNLVVVLGLVATVLAAGGIYGAVGFAVNQRTRELGIRVALGATRRAIVREVFVMGGKPVVKGLLIGLWLSVAMAAMLSENLRGAVMRIDSTDPLIYAAALFVLALAAAVAMIGPARRGSSADPLDALRVE